MYDGQRAGMATDPGNSPAAALADDGFLSMGFLRNKGATMSRPQPSDLDGDGQLPPHDNIALPTPGTAQRVAMVERLTPTPRGEDSEEDPFGHQLRDIGQNDGGRCSRRASTGTSATCLTALGHSSPS